MMAWAGMACGQVVMAQAPPPAVINHKPINPATTERTIKVVEMGKPAQKCTVLKSWVTPQGHKAYEVKAIDTGEMMTIEESGAMTAETAGGGKVRAMSTTIFHWGRYNVRPKRAPVSPEGSDNASGTNVCATPPCKATGTTTARLAPVPSKVSGTTTARVALTPSKATGTTTARLAPMPSDKGHEQMVSGAQRDPSEVTQVLPKPLTPPMPRELAEKIAQKEQAERMARQEQAERMAQPVAQVPTAPQLVQPMPRQVYIPPSAVPVKTAPQTVEVISPTRTSPYMPIARTTEVTSSPYAIQAAPISSTVPVTPIPRTTPVTPISRKAPVIEPSAVVEAPVVKPTPIFVEEPKTTILPAQPGDFRESWGKPKDHRSVKEATGPLPQAKSVNVDPLQNPEKYADSKSVTSRADAKTMKPAERVMPTPAVSASDPAPVMEKEQPRRIRTLFAGWGSKPKETWTTTTVKVEQPKTQSVVPPTRGGSDMAMGVESVQAANSGIQGPVRYVPVPVVTLPNATRPPSAKLPAPPPPRMPGAPQPNEPQGMMVNAFTPPNAAYTTGNGGQPTTGQPSPDFARRPGMIAGYPRYPNGQPYPNGQLYPQVARAPMQPTMANPGMATAQQGMPMAQNSAMNPAMSAANRGVVPIAYNQVVPGARPMVPAAAAAQSAAEQQTSAMLSTLHVSLYPSEREMAADSLAACDGRTHPHVVQALTTAATKDPAATVRAGCVRALAKMGVNTAPVLGVVQSLKSDADPRVRQAADEALGVLSPSK
jgi:hypothetical protein